MIIANNTIQPEILDAQDLMTKTLGQLNALSTLISIPEIRERIPTKQLDALLWLQSDLSHTIDDAWKVLQAA